MTVSTKKLCRKIDYTFKNPDYLELALTHRSASSQHNERAEFLGDGVLNFVVAHALYDRFPKATEGELSRYRAALVMKDTLAEIAMDLSLGDYIKLGSGELKSGGYRRASILADALEALFAAVLLDSGFDAARDLILRLFDTKINDVTKQTLKDPKSRLQEFLQSRRLSLPDYQVLNVEGEPHEQVFTVKCVIETLDIDLEGSGSSRRRAEQNAAEAAMKIIEEDKSQ